MVDPEGDRVYYLVGSSLDRYNVLLKVFITCNARHNSYEIQMFTP